MAFGRSTAKPSGSSSARRPNLSKADSPFPVDGSKPNFFLEDFEDRLLNTPGIRQRNTFPLPGEQGLAVVRIPGPDTDSVDADDGIIDGFGRNGHSLASGTLFTLPTIPPSYQMPIEFEFNEAELGFLPNSFGFVWTDGPPSSSLGLVIVTRNGNEFISDPVTALGDLARDGQTAEDVFLGVSAVDPIQRVRIIGGFRGELPSAGVIEIDHLQYGLIVPEPSTIRLIAVPVSLLFYSLVGKSRQTRRLIVGPTSDQTKEDSFDDTHSKRQSQVLIRIAGTTTRT